MVTRNELIKPVFIGWFSYKEVNRILRKHSQMGSSKYEFNPEQFEIDIQNKIIKQQQLKQDIHSAILSILKNNAHNMDQTFSTILEVLREIKTEYNL
jgi:hypothetical protein